MMDFGEAVRQFYGNYVNADGRAQRAAFWYALLYQVIIILVLLTVIFMADGVDELFDEILAAEAANEEFVVSDDLKIGTSGILAFLLLLCFALANFLPNIMLNIRRFHDLDRTGWFVLLFQVLGAIPLVALIATIGNLIWFTLPGTQGSNQYGPDPLGPDPDLFG